MQIILMDIMKGETRLRYMNVFSQTPNSKLMIMYLLLVWSSGYPWICTSVNISKDRRELGETMH